MKKPSLKKILQAALTAFKMSEEDWELLRFTRTASAVQIVQAVSLVAFDKGYRPKTIGNFLGRDRATISYGIDKMREECKIYKDLRNVMQSITDSLAYEHRHTFNAYLARSYSGMLTISPTPPEKVAGYWMSEGSRPYHNQACFPQIQWESEPVKVRITIEIEDDEKM